MDYTTVQWVWLGIAALCIGFAKMGLSAVAMLVVPIIASVFGGRESTGILLPLLVAGDIFAVIYYKHHIQIHEIRRLLVWVCVGILIGTLVGQYINDAQFKAVLSVSVMLCLAIMVYSEVKGKQFVVPNKLFFYALVGILGGFTSMVGNAAGAIISIYLLSREYPKESYISTYAWIFLIMNLLKMPFQIFVWKNIDMGNLYTTLLLIPLIFLGAAAGVYIVKRLNEKVYRRIIYAMTLIAAIMLLI